MIKPDRTIERSMDRLSRQDSVVKLDRVMCNMNGWSRQDSAVKLDRVMCNMNGWSRQDSVVKLDRTMLYNMNGQSRHDSVVKLDRAMLYNMNGQCRHDSVHGDQSTCNADVDRLNDSEKSSNVYGCPQAWKKSPVRISKDEAPTPLPVLGPLFISSLLFRLSRVLLGAWHFGLFRCVYSCFHYRLDFIREPAFYWVFYFIFPIYPCLFHHT